MRIRYIRDDLKKGKKNIFGKKEGKKSKNGTKKETGECEV